MHGGNTCGQTHHQSQTAAGEGVGEVVEEACSLRPMTLSSMRRLVFNSWKKELRRSGKS